MILKLLAGAGVLMLLLWAMGKIPLSYNLRNLTIRWKTTLLTALAFTAVIALLTVMMAFVEGMKRMTEGTGRADNVLVLSDGATDEGISNLPISEILDIENLAEVAREEGRPLASREAFMVAIQSAPNHDGGRPKRRYLQLRGIEDPRLSAWMHDIELLPGGSWFSDAGVQEAAVNGDGVKPAPMIQAVLGEGVAGELGRDRTPDQLASAKNPQRLDVGDTFTLGDRTWIVVGVMDSAGSTFNSEIWAKRSLAGAMFGKEHYTTLILRARDAATANRLKQYLAEDYKNIALNPKVELDFYKDLSETSDNISYAIWFLAVVMSVGGIFGVMNTMFAAVSQREGDIGVLRLLGFSRRQVLVSFLLESLFIALVGGLLGCAIGSLCDGWTANSVAGGHGGGKFIVLQLAVSAEIIATGLFLSLMMGFLGGLFPSLAAMRMRPLEALR
ncbi:MAG: ABC transporter permease [Pirellulaceae bacterium]|nr:ABC transporter permease [Pirellulaceae bacterium]